MLKAIITAGGLFLVLAWSACTINNVDNAPGLKIYFDSAQVSGTFCIYDNVHGGFTIYNKDRYVHRLSPGSSFKLMTTLIGLENGKLFDKDARIGNLSLKEAFRTDSPDFFRDLALKLGKDTIDKRIVSMSYGNMDTVGTADSIPKLAISPDEQLGLVKKMYFNQLHFQKRTVDVVRDLMQRESTPNYGLAYVTGRAKDSTGAPMVWVLGWEEERKNPYFFVLNITGNSDEDLAAKAEPLLRSLLRDQGFFKGLK